MWAVWACSVHVRVRMATCVPTYFGYRLPIQRASRIALSLSPSHGSVSDDSVRQPPGRRLHMGSTSVGTSAVILRSPNRSFLPTSASTHRRLYVSPAIRISVPKSRSVPCRPWTRPLHPIVLSSTCADAGYDVGISRLRGRVAIYWIAVNAVPENDVGTPGSLACTTSSIGTVAHRASNLSASSARIHPSRIGF